MRYIIALVAALLAVPASAQDLPFHFSFAAGSVSVDAPDPQGQVVHNGVSTPIAPDFKTKPYVAGQFDITPANSLGFGIRALKFSGSGSVSGSEPSTSQVFLWKTDLDSYIKSTSPMVKGSIGYSASSSVSLGRQDYLAIYGHGGGRAYGSVMGGLSHLTFQTATAQTREQNDLLLNIPPGKTVADPTAILEKYLYQANSTVKFSGFGPTVGFEGTVCPINHLILYGRATLAWYMWGSGAENSGSWDWTKRGSLVPTSGGVEQPLGADLFTPIRVDAPVPAPTATRVRGLELEGSIRLQLTKNIQIGVGPSQGRYSNLPMPETWVIPAGFSAEKGHWAATGDSYFQYTAWTAVVNFRF